MTSGLYCVVPGYMYTLNVMNQNSDQGMCIPNSNEGCSHVTPTIRECQTIVMVLHNTVQVLYCSLQYILLLEANQKAIRKKKGGRDLVRGSPFQPDYVYSVLHKMHSSLTVRVSICLSIHPSVCVCLCLCLCVKFMYVCCDTCVHICIC